LVVPPLHGKKVGSNPKYKKITTNLERLYNGNCFDIKKTSGWAAPKAKNSSKNY